MRDNKEWRLCEIFDVRIAKFFKEEVSLIDKDDNQLFEDIPVTEHPQKSSNPENELTYF